MKHGTYCDCMMCTVGKKLGMIKEDQRDHREHYNNGVSRNVCENCSHSHKKNGTCDCGCK